MKLPKFFRIILCIILSTFVTTFSNAAENNSLSIPRIDGVPTLADFAGMSPNSSLAKSMSKAENFTQREPDVGQPSSQRTEVYIGYDDENFYTVFLAFDSNPELIRGNFSARENIFGDDWVGVMVDTFNDQQSSFAFGSNPRAIQFDARWTEGSSRRGGFDPTFDAVWFNEGELNDQGYMVSFAIPFRSLRFNEVDEQTWRIQFTRTIPRNNEESHWPEYSIDVEGRLNQAALLTGITVSYTHLTLPTKA